MNAPLDKEVALRVGLAAKELNGVTTRELLNLLITIMGEPIVPSKLARMRAKKVREQAGTLLAHTPHEKFENAFALLKGRGIQQYLHPSPEFAQGLYCEIHGSLRVACASNSAENIDGEFARCIRFLIYQVSPRYIRLIDIREPLKHAKKNERIQLRANLLKDCALLYATSIGAASAAKAVKVGVHSIALGEAQTAYTQLNKLQAVLAQDKPPPWLVKAMGEPLLGLKIG